MRARSASLLLLHYEPGTHEEITRWHEEIHRPEMHASIPHIYHSEDWVAPAEYLPARPPTDLGRGGGEYLSLYWSDGSVEDLLEGVRQFAQASSEAGKYHPFQEVVWRERLRVTGGQVRPGLDVTVDTVPLLHNTGLVAIISRGRWDASRLFQTDGTGVFSGHYSLEPMHDPGIRVDLYFVERGDPLAQFQQLELPAETIFTGVYRPIVPGKYDLFYQ